MNRKVLKNRENTRKFKLLMLDLINKHPKLLKVLKSISELNKDTLSSNNSVITITSNFLNINLKIDF